MTSLTLRGRWFVLGTAVVAVAAIPVALAWPSLAAITPQATHMVTSISALQTALAAPPHRPRRSWRAAWRPRSGAAAGEVIQLADGSYSTSSTISISRSGTASAPIVVEAQHAGGATITGSGGFSIGSSVSYVTLEGFKLTGSQGLSIPVGATHIQVTRNTFEMAGSVQYWLTVGGDDAQIDHNTFQHKSTIGNFIEVVGPGSSGMAQNTWIHHNYLLDQSYTGSNGGESIRVGLSGRQHSAAHAIVEYNLFEQCNGDLEVISVKSTDDIIRYNTLRNSHGTITLRHGWGSLVEGNYLLGNSTGIRMFGNNHTIINNVIENSSGQALEIGGGEVRDDTTSGTDHEAAYHDVVAFNTFVNDQPSPIQMGDGGKAYQPSDITVADNIVSGGSGSAESSAGGSGLTYTGNILNGVSGGAMPSSGYTTANPRLVADSAGLYRLSAGSPAIDAAKGSFPQVTLDMDGQTRSGAKDVGADEFGAAGPLREPLTTADVGPASGGGTNPSPTVSPTNPSPTSASPTPPSTTRYEAESGTCQGTTDSNHLGFSGTGFCNTDNVTGASMTWTVPAASAGTATVTFRYSNGTGADRPANITVNGAMVSTVNFPVTTDWDTWANSSLTVSLKAGSNTITVVSTTSSGDPNLDYLDVGRSAARRPRGTRRRPAPARAPSTATISVSPVPGSTTRTTPRVRR
jgi:poly(beta-D-mannuronate) lyase